MLDSQTADVVWLPRSTNHITFYTTDMNLSKLTKTSKAVPSKVSRVVFAAVAVAALAGCAGLTTPAPPEQVVRQLATQRWQALLAKDFDKAYGFSVPSYRALKTAEYYKNKRQATPVKWISAEIFNVECEASKCAVRIKLESKPIVPFSNFDGTIVGGLDETWVLDGGKWWMFETL
jgi:hypothetical protein